MTYPAGTKLRQKTPTIHLVGQERPVWTVEENATLRCGRVVLELSPDELERDWEPVPDAVDNAIATLRRAFATMTAPTYERNALDLLESEVRRLRALPTVAQSAVSALPESERQGGQKVAQAVTSHVQRKP